MEKLLTICILIAVGLLASSTVQGEGILYFSENSNSDGLYELNILNGQATHLGQTGANSKELGLAPSAAPELLYGSKYSTLLHINADGSGSVDVGGTGTEGLAYDPTTDTLYGTINTAFFTMDKVTGAKLVTLPSPGVDIEGLAYGNGFIYGVVSFGTSGNGNLYKYDIAGGMWSLIGYVGTGVRVYGAGLAYNPDLDVLYLKFDGGNLYSVNPATAEVTLIGDTGIFDGGGLAYVDLDETATLVDLDIKPGSCPNPLNVKNQGVLPMAILGTDAFDVGEIDIASLEILGVKPIKSSYEDVATPVADSGEPEDCLCTTDGPDGYMDLTLKFDAQEIINVLGPVEDGNNVILTLTGLLLDETPITGNDCILIIQKGKPETPAEPVSAPEKAEAPIGPTSNG